MLYIYFKRIWRVTKIDFTKYTEYFDLADSRKMKNNQKWIYFPKFVEISVNNKRQKNV